MSRFKDLLMEREDQFWSIAQEKISESENVSEFLSNMKEHFHLHLSNHEKDIEDELHDAWFDKHSKYLGG
tara:strand:+ start:616 stop:825 length:210 start_codon:yes stop_codon:yes gene_type:complete